MDNIFTTLLTLSWQAGVIALAVALVRLPLRRAPRRRDGARRPPRKRRSVSGAKAIFHPNQEVF